MEHVLYALEIQLVSSLCQDWVEVRMNSHNVLGVWRFAEDHFLQSLEKSSWKFSTARFTEVSKKDEFLDLPEDMVKFLMSSDELCFKEEEVWMGLMAWMGNKQA